MKTKTEEFHLRLTADAPEYCDKAFCLEMTDSAGHVVEYACDGLQIADLLADAFRAGMPDGSKLADVLMHAGLTQGPPDAKPS